LNTLARTSDYADWVVSEYSKGSLPCAIGVTTRYRDGSAISIANSSYKKFCGRFFYTAFNDNFHKKNVRDQFFVIGFLDYDNSIDPNTRAIEATGFHHHSIILTTEEMAKRMSVTGAAHPGDSDGVFYPHVNRLPFMADHLVQTLHGEEHLRRWVNYAAKGCTRLSPVTSDAFLMPRYKTIIPEALDVREMLFRRNHV
jgi:hypothetical protein